jgi:hypothetical protein
LTESQVRALEKAKQEKEAHGEIETAHPGYLGAQDTYYVGTIKGVGRIYQQTFIDTYAKVAMAKLYDRKNALVAADMLNDRVIPFYDQQQVPLLRSWRTAEPSSVARENTMSTPLNSSTRQMDKRPSVLLAFAPTTVKPAKGVRERRKVLKCLVLPGISSLKSRRTFSTAPWSRSNCRSLLSS